jgi:SNF family Na+-dependent transporter
LHAYVFYDRYTCFGKNFRNHILQDSGSIEDLGGFNFKLVVGLLVSWAITGACLIFGVKWLGRISLFTATFPYLIVLILLIRGVTLDGARIGLDYYILKPDFSFFWEPKVGDAVAINGALLGLSNSLPPKIVLARI